MHSSTGALSLEAFKEEVLTCNECILARTRKHLIFGEGNNHAPILIIGEAPGRDDDLQGRPIVGKSGQLLDKILDAHGFTRDDHVYFSFLSLKGTIQPVRMFRAINA